MLTSELGVCVGRLGFPELRAGRGGLIRMALLKKVNAPCLAILESCGFFLLTDCLNLGITNHFSMFGKPVSPSRCQMLQ